MLKVEQILIGMDNKNRIILVVYKKDPIIINPNNIAEEFNKIEKKYPGFKEIYFKSGSTRIITDEELKQYLQKTQQNTKEKEIQQESLEKFEQKINEELQALNIKIKNNKVYEELINRCKEDIFTGKQIKLRHSDYKLGKTMFASQDVGKQRNNQEDSVLILKHPLNQDFKLLAVSDGVGGYYGGEQASRHIVAKLTEWFENLNPNIDKNMEKVQSSLNNMLPHILDDLNNAPREAAATLSAVIIGKDKTLITNIGDSRVYSMKNGKINQETIDDSQVQELFENKIIPNKELMRFHHDSNVITNSVKKNNEVQQASFRIINNASYDRIIATSDGVTDCMTEKELQNLMKHTNSEQLTSKIVNYAINNDSHLDKVINNLPKQEAKKIVTAINNNPEFYMSKINGGKDNTTVAAYIKK